MLVCASAPVIWPSGPRRTGGSIGGGASRLGEAFAVRGGRGTVEQADAISINAQVAIDRAFDDLLRFMGDLPDNGLPRVFGGLVALGAGVDPALQLGAHLFGGVGGALLRGLLLRGADMHAVWA